MTFRITGAVSVIFHCMRARARSEINAKCKGHVTAHLQC